MLAYQIFNLINSQGETMIHSEIEMRKWKREQVKYFKKYMKSFPAGSKEHDLLKKGIEDLENSI